METVQEYPHQAEQCERQAAEAQLESSRKTLLATALIWRKLAASSRPILATQLF
jgi:hypothetical protein